MTFTEWINNLEIVVSAPKDIGDWTDAHYNATDNIMKPYTVQEDEVVLFLCYVNKFLIFMNPSFDEILPEIESKFPEYFNGNKKLKGSIIEYCITKYPGIDVKEIAQKI